MYRIPKDKLTEILETVNIIDVISETILLKKVGHNFVGLCPFHTEKTPSFTVSHEKQIYYCFGCKEGGNTFNFMMKYYGISFLESISIIADRFGIKIPKKPLEVNSQHEILIRINHDAMMFFHNNLLNLNQEHPILLYLKSRGIRKESIKNLKLGYAHESWYNLKKYLIEEKHWGKKIVNTSGLVVLKNNTSYDRFRKRIIFPIFDIRNVVIGFGARVIDTSLPKYINSPETMLYNKSKSLYGINIAKSESRKSGIVFIVEGYFDFITLYQFGIKNSVATLGTSITVNHINLIKGMIGRQGKVFLVYDSDPAGMNAVYKSLEIFQKESINVKIVSLPSGYDPDSHIVNFGIKEFIKISKKAMTSLSFMIKTAIEKHSLDIEGKIKIINTLKHFIASSNDLISRSLAIQYFSEQIGVDSEIIKKEVNMQIKKLLYLKTNANSNIETNSNNELKRNLKFSKTYKLERQILTIILQFPTPKIVDLIKTKCILRKFENELFNKISNIAINVSGKNKSRINSIIKKCETIKERSIVAKLIMIDEEWNENGCITIINQFENITSKNKNLMKKIAEAELSGDDCLLNKLLEKKQLLARTKIANNNPSII